jgi:4-hydroxy-4-methyl-2-oxoglutarate aldolase
VSACLVDSEKNPVVDTFLVLFFDNQEISLLVHKNLALKNRINRNRTELIRTERKEMQSTMLRLTKILRRLEAVDTAALCDADKSAGTNWVQVMSNNMKLRTRNIVGTHRKMIGVARTVQFSTPEDFLAVLQGLNEAECGEILCVNTMNSSKAVAGGLFITEAERIGLGGIVIDGAVRDISSMDNSGIQCYSTSVNPYSGSIAHLGQTQVPIKCGGTNISPGDIVVGDSDGVIITDIESLENIINSAEMIVETEKKIFNAMEEGHSLHSLTNYHEHVSAIKNGKESALQFKV